MIEMLGQYKRLIISGMMFIPSFLYMMYATIYLLEKKKIVKKLMQMRKPLMERINGTIDSQERGEMEEYMVDTIEKIRDEIHAIRQEIHEPKEMRKRETVSYEREYNAIKDMEWWQTFYPSYEENNEKILHREQVRIMNQNITKFIAIYRDRQNTINQKDKIIQELQQRVKEAEYGLQMERYEQENKNIDDLERELDDIQTELYELKTEAEDEIWKNNEQALSEIEKKIKHEKKSISILIFWIIIMILLGVGILIVNLW